MSPLEVIKKIEKKLKAEGLIKTVECWNLVFPETEHLTESTFGALSGEKITAVIVESKSMIVDLLRTKSSNTDIVKVYNSLYSKKISQEDIV